MTENENENQLVNFRYPKKKLAIFDKNHPDNRAKSISYLLDQDNKQHEENGDQPEKPIDNSKAFEDAKKDLRDSFFKSGRIEKEVAPNPQTWNCLKSLGFAALNIKDLRLSFDSLIEKVTVKENMHKLCSNDPNELKQRHIEPELWELFLQLCEEKVKQIDLQKKVNEERKKMHST